MTRRPQVFVAASCIFVRKMGSVRSTITEMWSDDPSEIANNLLSLQGPEDQTDRFPLRSGTYVPLSL